MPLTHSTKQYDYYFSRWNFSGTKMLFPLHYILCHHHHRHNHKTKTCFEKPRYGTANQYNTRYKCNATRMVFHCQEITSHHHHMSHVMTITMCAQQCMGRRMNCMHFKNFKAYYISNGTGWCLRVKHQKCVHLFRWMMMMMMVCCRENQQIKRITQHNISKSQQELHSHHFYLSAKKTTLCIVVLFLKDERRSWLYFSKEWVSALQRLW